MCPDCVRRLAIHALAGDVETLPPMSLRHDPSPLPHGEAHPVPLRPGPRWGSSFPTPQSHLPTSLPTGRHAAHRGPHPQRHTGRPRPKPHPQPPRKLAATQPAEGGLDTPTAALPTLHSTSNSPNQEHSPTSAPAAAANRSHLGAASGTPTTTAVTQPQAQRQTGVSRDEQPPPNDPQTIMSRRRTPLRDRVGGRSRRCT